MSKPFRRPPYRTIPERPRRPHGFLELAERSADVRLDGGASPMAYREMGSGEPLLLVHGLMTSSYSWRYVMAPLAELGFRVIAPDLPGAGASAIPDVPCSVDLLTDSIAAFQDALGITGCAIIGNSMGGYLCMRLALREPERMSRLVNVHSPGIPLRRLKALRVAFGAPVVRSLVSAVVARDPERWVFRNVHYFDESLKSREETRAYADPLRAPEGRMAFLSWMGDALDPSEMERLVSELSARRSAQEPFPVPLMLLYARRDPMVPPRVGRALAALLPDAEKVWLHESSHFAHVDTPEMFIDAIAPFLQSARKRS